MGKFSIIFIVVSVLIFQLFLRDFISNSGSLRIIAAGAFSGVAGLLGYLVDNKTKKK